MTTNGITALPEQPERAATRALADALRGKTFTVKVAGKTATLTIPPDAFFQGDGYHASGGYVVKSVEARIGGLSYDGEERSTWGMDVYVLRRFDDAGDPAGCLVALRRVELPPKTLEAMKAEVAKALPESIDWDAIAVETERFEHYGKVRSAASEAERAIERYESVLRGYTEAVAR